jgi:ribosome-associated translation inhibitor RaiA
MTTMATLDIQGLPPASPLRARVTRQLTKLLGLLRTEPSSARAAFFDDDGPKGGNAIRCALTVRLPHRPNVRVEHTAGTRRLAFDGAFAALDRQLAEQRERRVERSRRPKKYYVAKRLLTEGLSGED